MIPDAGGALRPNPTLNADLHCPLTVGGHGYGRATLQDVVVRDSQLDVQLTGRVRITRTLRRKATARMPLAPRQHSHVHSQLGGQLGAVWMATRLRPVLCAGGEKWEAGENYFPVNRDLGNSLSRTRQIRSVSLPYLAWRSECRQSPCGRPALGRPWQ